MKMNNLTIMLVIGFCMVAMWFHSNVYATQHLINTQPAVASIVHTTKEVHGVMTGSVPVEKYFNVNRIMNSMVR